MCIRWKEEHFTSCLYCIYCKKLSRFLLVFFPLESLPSSFLAASISSVYICFSCWYFLNSIVLATFGLSHRCGVRVCVCVLGFIGLVLSQASVSVFCGMVSRSVHLSAAVGKPRRLRSVACTFRDLMRQSGRCDAGLLVLRLWWQLVSRRGSFSADAVMLRCFWMKSEELMWSNVFEYNEYKMKWYFLKEWGFSMRTTGWGLDFIHSVVKTACICQVVTLCIRYHAYEINFDFDCDFNKQRWSTRDAWTHHLMFTDRTHDSSLYMSDLWEISQLNNMQQVRLGSVKNGIKEL